MKKHLNLFSKVKSYFFFIVLLGLFSTPLIMLVSYSSSEKITPNDEFKPINNIGVPDINITTWNLTIDGKLDTPYTFSYENFTLLPSVEIKATLQCVTGPIGTAIWKGVTLKYLLNLVNPTEDALEVVFYGIDGFSSSLTISEVIKYDVILAYEMNGVPLPREEGFPLRVVAPYHIGYKWVKYLDHVELVDYDYKGYFEVRGYSDDGLLSSSIDWRYHAFLLSISFIIGGLSITSGLRFTPRGKIFRNLPKFISRKFHIFSSLLFVFISVLTFIYWLRQVFIFKGSIFYSYHGIISLLAIILLILSYSSGIVFLLLRSKNSSWWHKNISFLAILCYFISLSAGLILIV